jgi:hypothetical protein
MYPTSWSKGWQFCCVYSATPCSNRDFPQTLCINAGKYSPCQIRPNLRILYKHLLSLSFYTCGAGIAQSVTDSLGAGRSGDQISVGARFSTPVQTGPGDHPASYTRTMGTGSFPGGKRPERGVDYPPHLALRLKKE